MASTKTFLDAIKARHSFYDLTKSSPIPDSKIVQLLQDIMLHVPSAFNSQTNRAILLLNKSHDDFWQATTATISASTPAETFKAKAEPRLAGFAAAYGTILFFEDTEEVKSWHDKTHTIGTAFASWSHESSGMHQFAMWTALEAEGLGANLQHYNFSPQLQENPRKLFNVPPQWALRAQLVFGARKDQTPPPSKEKKSFDQTIKVFN